MSVVYNFLFGKTTYKGDQYKIPHGLEEVAFPLPVFSGACHLYFGDEGVQGMRFDLLPSVYRLNLVTDYEEEFLAEMTVEEESVYLACAVPLFKRAELMITGNGKEERIPLW